MHDLASWTDPQRAALDALHRAKSLVLTGHMRPDGDCLGSQAALARALESLGKTVRIVNPDLPDARYDYLCEATRFEAFEDVLPSHDTVVLLDCHESGRLGAMGELVAGGTATKVVIDHHPQMKDGWWDHAFLDPAAAATGCLVSRIARALGAKPDSVMDQAVLTALVTDTGWFKYSNTDHETLSLAAEIVGRGLDASELYQRLHQRSAPSEPKGVAELLGRLQYHGDGRVALVDLPWEPADRPKLDEADVVLDILRAVEAVEVVLYLRELEDGRVKLSARSKTAFDVNALARKFGGGGHAKASGATIQGDLADVGARLVMEAVSQLEHPEPRG